MEWRGRREGCCMQFINLGDWLTRTEVVGIHSLGLEEWAHLVSFESWVGVDSGGQRLWSLQEWMRQLCRPTAAATNSLCYAWSR